MGNHQNGGAVLPDLFHTPVALGLKKDVAYRQRLVDDQNLRLHINRKRKSQPHKHTAGIRLNGLIDEISDIGKLQNILKLRLHLLSGKAHHGAVHKDIFNAGVIHVESGSQLQ